MTSDLYTYWTTLADDELTVDKVESTLDGIQDDLSVAASCVDRLIDDVDVQQALLSLGIRRTQRVADRCRAVAFSSVGRDTTSEETDHYPVSSDTVSASKDALLAHFRIAPHDAQLCALRATLLRRLDRLNTFVEISKNPENLADEVVEEVTEWEDDPWADEENAGSDQGTHGGKSKGESPFSVSQFLADDLLHSLCRLISLQRFAGLQILFERHGPSLWPYRIAIVDSIPEHTPPSKYRALLLALDPSQDSELEPIFHPWRPEHDWTEAVDVQGILDELGSMYHAPSSHSMSMYSSPRTALLTANQLSMWYRTRAEAIVNSTGLVDNALALIQHGAAQGIPGLDELGEELGLLSRLVYDTSQEPDIQDDWTLTLWRSMDASAIVRAYLAHSSPESLPNDITRLVMPYLFVLESRAERSGKPDPQLPTRLLYNHILCSPLCMVASIFENSKPTLPSAERLIRDDEDIVRLALSCLYGSDSLDQWPVMSRIFECLPAWEIGSNDDDGRDVVDTTLLSLGAFVTPSTSHPRCTAADLLTFFQPLPRNSLSQVLDMLDVHLESGEILSRWDVPAPLCWFLQSNHDATEQRAWANRMARRAGSPEDQLDTLEDWEWLLEDMIKLSGTNDTTTSSAFGLLKPEEIIHSFFGGLLSTGKFDIARDILASKHNTLNLNPKQVEEICVSCSREFYDNAHSGNYKFGDMKLAYDCLDVAQPTERILREKEFIEATSRISSFNVTSRPGIPLSPLEIRLTKDRLTLISRVLSSNNDAYKHTDVILDLVHKLGLRGDLVAEVKALAMLADTALQAEDFARAYQLSERMVDTVVQLRSSSPTSLIDTKIMEASEVCWVACFQLGRQLEFKDAPKKLMLLGHALELCPPEKLHEVLAFWRRLEKEDIEAREERLLGDRIREATSVFRDTMASGNTASSLRDRLKHFHMPSPPLLGTPDAAMLASRTFRTVAANFPFSVGHRSNQSDISDGDRSRSRKVDEDVSTQATRVLSRGIGWLIGTDESM